MWFRISAVRIMTKDANYKKLCDTLTACSA